MRMKLKADLALALCSLIWGATFVVVQQALESASVFVFLAIRFALAALLLWLIWRTRLGALTAPTLRAGGLIGLLMFAGYAFQTGGLKFTTPSKAAFITGMAVVLVPILLATLWRRPAEKWIWLGALAAVAGLYFLTVPAGAEAAAAAEAAMAGSGGLNRGDLLVFGCAVMFALHIIFVGLYTPHHSVGALTLLQVATTAALAALAVPLVAATGWELPRVEWTPGFVTAVLITAVGATAICFSIQVWAQRYTSPTHTAILFALEPVFAGITSYLVLGERLGGRALAGAGLILLGILLAELRGPTQAAPESPAPTQQL